MPGLGSFLTGLERTTRNLPMQLHEMGLQAQQIAEKKKARDAQAKKQKTDDAFKLLHVYNDWVKKGNPIGMRKRAVKGINEVFKTLAPNEKTNFNPDLENGVVNEIMGRWNKALDNPELGRKDVMMLSFGYVDELNKADATEKAKLVSEQAKLVGDIKKDEATAKIAKDKQDKLDVDKIRTNLIAGKELEMKMEKHEKDMLGGDKPKKDMSPEKALQRISTIKASIARFDKTDKMDATLAALIPGYKPGKKISSDDKKQMMEQFTREIEHLEQFTPEGKNVVRQQAITELKNNKLPITEANIKYAIGQLNAD